MSANRIILLLLVAAATFAVVYIYARPEILEEVWLWLIGLAGTVVRLFQLAKDFIKKLISGEDKSEKGSCGNNYLIMAEKKSVPSVLKYKKLMNFLFVTLFLLVEAIILYLMFHALVISDLAITQVVALELVLIWFGILFGYYAWAVYFYAINFGLTNQDWAEIREKKERGEHVEEPSENPNKEETLGLPKGTVRGSLAITLMVGALAMVIYSIGLPTELKGDTFIADYFDFFKTAFLMMIAFYFGNKSLEAIGYKSKEGWVGKGKSEADEKEPAAGGSEDTKSDESDFDDPKAQG